MTDLTRLHTRWQRAQIHTGDTAMRLLPTLNAILADGRLTPTQHDAIRLIATEADQAAARYGELREALEDRRIGRIAFYKQGKAS